MYYEDMPLYPGMKPAGHRDGCMRVRLFDVGARDHPPAMREYERVQVENPCRPGEYAEVALGVDDCGSLVICVRRPDDRLACGCQGHRGRPDCRWPDDRFDPPGPRPGGCQPPRRRPPRRC